MTSSSNGNKPDLTPRRRFLANLMGGRKGKRISVSNPTSIACTELMDRIGIHFPEAHLQADQMAELAAAGYEILGFDTVMPEFSVQQEAAALGCEVNWGSDTIMPEVLTHPVKNVSDIVIPEDILEKPPFRVVLDAISLLRREYGDRVAIIGKVMGPWTICYHTVGIEDFLIMTVLEPDKVAALLDAYIPVTVAFANAQLRAGADAVTLPDHATGSMVSPKTYEKFLVPMHHKMLGQIGGPTILHVCGKCLDRIPLIITEGYDAYHFEWINDPQKAVAAAKGQLSLFGGISTIDCLLRGTPEDVYHQARYNIAAGVASIGPECAVSPETPVANLKAIVAAAEEGY
ncbi:MAG: MtaA/CmuA family methyltransferase [Dehalococcoidales bacterium]|nr:MtaA/CmuA family methyltransferase [Dehalococcoidales bacterium]